MSTGEKEKQDAAMSNVAIDGSESWKEPSASSGAAVNASGAQKVEKRKRTRKRKRKGAADGKTNGATSRNDESWEQEEWVDETQAFPTSSSHDSSNRLVESVASTIVDHVPTPQLSPIRPSHVNSSRENTQGMPLIPLSYCCTLYYRSK